MINQTKIETVYLIESERSYVIKCKSGKEYEALMSQHFTEYEPCITNDDEKHWCLSYDNGKTCEIDYRAYNEEAGKRMVDQMRSTRSVIIMDCT